MSNTFTNTRIGRRQYLITYSRADEVKFPTRESFGEMIEFEFNAGKSAVKVQHWACCRESHSDGGFHYHCAVKLNGTKKWLSVKENISKKHNIVVNFSDSHDFYISAYRYLCKQDENVAHSKNHPDLKEASSPITKKSIAGNKAATRKRYSQSSSSTVQSKRKRLSYSDVATFVRNNAITSYMELLACAETRKEEGLTDISEFVFSHSEKNIRELITKTWLMQKAPAEIARKHTSRMNLSTELLLVIVLLAAINSGYFVQLKCFN